MFSGLELYLFFTSKVRYVLHDSELKIELMLNNKKLGEVILYDRDLYAKLKKLITTAGTKHEVVS